MTDTSVFIVAAIIFIFSIVFVVWYLKECFKALKMNKCKRLGNAKRIKVGQICIRNKLYWNIDLEYMYENNKYIMNRKILCFKNIELNKGPFIVRINANNPNECYFVDEIRNHKEMLRWNVWILELCICYAAFSINYLFECVMSVLKGLIL